jgi:hypothetical protein
MNDESVFLDSRRRGMLRYAAARTVDTYADLGIGIHFNDDAAELNSLIKKYLKLRGEFAEFQNTGENLLANHKVAALYIWVFRDTKFSSLFSFERSKDDNLRRAVMATFIYFIMYGVMSIDRNRMDESLHEDLEYCLLMERPQNLEWLCLTMHAICRYRGSPTNITQ